MLYIRFDIFNTPMSAESYVDIAYLGMCDSLDKIRELNSDMKKLLPNVTFYSPDVVPNKDVIKNAEQVWIQTNCISHAAYYRIESALGEKTKLRFFPNQNARSCAEKMAGELKK
jgi:hypothetical protein